MSATVTLWPTVGRIGVQCGTGTQLTAFARKEVKHTTLVKDILEGKSSLFLDVIGIKVTRPSRTEFGPFKSYTRTIRFEFFGGEVLDITCSGAIEKYIKLRSVKAVKPVPKPHPGHPAKEDWLTPKVYKGTSDRENA